MGRDAANPVGRNRYRLLEALGERRRATVYRGHDTALDTERAIKVLPAAYAAFAEKLRRFKREARAMARLNHAHIVAVHDIGVELGRAYIVMELMKGGTLHDMIKERPLEPLEALRTMRAVMAALEAAHDAGVVHRDLQPKNIFFTDKGVCKVAEFGLARIHADSEGGSRLTLMGQRLGTIPFVAPEQLKDAHTVDGRADIYAAGATLYFSVLGKGPVGAFFEEDDYTKLPSPLADVVRKATQREPEHRFATAGEMERALAEVQRDFS